MIQKFLFYFFSGFVVLTILTTTTKSHARKGAKGNSLPISSGIVFSSPSDATFLNPAGLVDGSLENLRGFWRGDNEDAMIHLNGSSSSLGWGLGYVGPTNETHFVEGGLGFNLNKIKLGLGLESNNFEGLDGNIGLNMDLSKVRLAFVGRGLSGQLDRLDFGLGFYGTKYRFEIDVKKPSPFLNTADFFDLLLFDIGLAVMADPLTIGFGTDTSLANGTLGDFNFHAGFDFMLGRRFSIQAHYRPWSGERGGDEWVAGARLVF